MAAQRSSNAPAGTEKSSTSSVIAIANTPSLNASMRSVSKRSSIPLCSARPGRFLRAQVAPEEIDRLLPRVPRVTLVVGAEPVVLGEEGVARALIELER